jgi:hypothetical protein
MIGVIYERVTSYALVRARASTWCHIDLSHASHVDVTESHHLL